MKLLAIDTSGPVAAAALAEETDGAQKLIAGFRLQSGLTHSETLMPMTEQMFSLARIDKKELDAVAVTAGPGSFTGLRIGVSAAKGLCFALDLPLVAVPTLDVIAYQMAGAPGVVCPMMDARRGQVYTAAYRFSGNEMEQLLTARAVPVEALAEELNTMQDAVTLLGDGVPVYLDRMKELLTVPFTVAPVHRDRQSAEALAALAFKYLAEGKMVDPASFTPEYLRPSQAERNFPDDGLLIRRAVEAMIDDAHKAAIGEISSASYEDVFGRGND
ncbi:MAG: tRNA (adenosine(37)-N6)-threonylcarbamoyltransferase complex dimerization subunit type 1 TsaB [Lachnospiraceae bacterium]|nr:tRNA (adenosine(37)-N6)-threonylcarbamoyltransferase complex dimerization subunit type 1 TsaB [Lachnospiraceae bacterium]